MLRSKGNQRLGLSIALLCMVMVAANGQPGLNVQEYAASKFDLGLSPNTQISTVEGNTTDIVTAMLSVQTTPTPGESFQNKGFVYAQGNQFFLNGQPFFCSGTNAFYAGLKWIMSDNEVAVMMKEQAARGVTAMRVFAFSSFDSVPESIMPSFGEYNEEAIRRLDLMLLSMAKYGIRAIMVLSNYWDFLGGMQDWVDQKYGPGQPLELFYTDAFLRQQYKDYVKTIITRTSTLTGLKYKDDPTIMAWVLANEPRAPNFEKDRGLKPGEMICNWVKEMSNYVRSLDSNHMVSVGDEGMRVDGDGSGLHAWINDGYEGVDFVCNLQYADFATLHAYPDAWGMSADGGYKWLGENYIKDRKQIADKANKPIIFEEYGMRRGYLPSRDPLFRYLQGQANQNQYACTLVWAVSHYNPIFPDSGYLGAFSIVSALAIFHLHEGTVLHIDLENGLTAGYNDGQGYVFGYTGPDSDGSVSVVEQNNFMLSKNLGNVNPVPVPIVQSPNPPKCKDIPPDNKYTCKQQARWGKCNEPWMNGFCRKTCKKC
jgi:mannan endo-1,4-beta-mannosidase